MPSPSRTRARRANPWRSALLALLALASLLAVFGWRATLPTRGLAALPSAERHALYARTLESLETACRVHSENLTEFCRDQAELALRFPECDAACRTLATPHLPQASR